MNPIVERTHYGYRVVAAGQLLPHQAQHACDTVRRLVPSDRTTSFAVLWDMRGVAGVPTWTSAILTDTLAWLQLQGMTRSAVVFDDTTTFLHMRTASQTAGVYEAERYFNSHHHPLWHEDALRWLTKGEDELWSRRGEHLTELAMMLDGLSEGILLCDHDGRILHENTALRRLLNRDVDHGNVRAMMSSFAAEQLRLVRSDRASSVAERASTIVRTPMRAYRIRSTSSQRGWFGTNAGLLISLEPVSNVPMDDSAVQERFGLTDRELVVARLVATGKTNLEIAGMLQISTYTARNHVERILAKLKVPNRTSVSAVLLSDAMPVLDEPMSVRPSPLALALQ